MSPIQKTLYYKKFKSSDGRKRSHESKHTLQSQTPVSNCPIVYLRSKKRLNCQVLQKKVAGSARCWHTLKAVTSPFLFVTCHSNTAAADFSVKLFIFCVLYWLAESYSQSNKATNFKHNNFTLNQKSNTKGHIQWAALRLLKIWVTMALSHESNPPLKNQIDG